MLIEISRLDTGRLEPDITVFPLQEVFERLEVEFEPLAREKGLDLRMVPTRRVGALRPSPAAARAAEPGRPMPSSIRRRARCCWACAGDGDELSASRSCDTGPGIPKSKRAVIFKEFERLEETASIRCGGLGLGLSIVERIGKVLDHRVDLHRCPAAARSSRSICRAPSPGWPSPPRRGAVGRPHRRPERALHRQRAGRAARHAGPAERLGLQGHHGAQRRGGIARLAETGARADIILADYHLDDGTGLEASPPCAAAGSHTPVIIISADHSAEVQREVRLGLRPAAQAAEGGGAARPDAPAHVAAGHGRGVRLRRAA